MKADSWSCKRSSTKLLAVALVVAACNVISPTVAGAHPASGIAADRAGRIYFLAFDGIMRVDERGRLTQFVKDDRSRVAHHLVIDAEGNLYTVSHDDGKIWKVSPTGQFTLYHEQRSAGAPQVGTYGDPFTIGADGAVFFVPEKRRGVSRVRGDVVEVYADSTFAFGDLHGSSMAWSATGDLYVTDQTRVLKVAPNGSVTVVGEHRPPPLSLAMGIAVDSAYRVYVADYAASRVIRISPSLETKAFGSGRFVRPTGVTVTPDGDVYVFDGRVWKIAADGDISLVACGFPSWLDYAAVLFVPLLLALWMVLGRKSSLRDRILRIIIAGLVMTPLYFLARSGCSPLEARYAVYALLIVAAAWSLNGRRPNSKVGVVAS